MTSLGAELVRRRFVAWVVTVTICAAAVSADLFVAPQRARLAGMDLSAVLAAAPYVAALALLVTSLRWAQAMRAKHTRRITVRELRELAGRR